MESNYLQTLQQKEVISKQKMVISKYYKKIKRGYPKVYTYASKQALVQIIFF